MGENLNRDFVDRLLSLMDAANKKLAAANLVADVIPYFTAATRLSEHVFVGVDNVLNKGVPQGATTATGSGSAIYSFRGRNLYAGFRARF